MLDVVLKSKELKISSCVPPVLFLSMILSLLVWRCLFLARITLTLSLTINCTCCCDEIKGTQDLKIYSHAHSLILSR